MPRFPTWVILCLLAVGARAQVTETVQATDTAPEMPGAFAEDVSLTKLQSLLAQQQSAIEALTTSLEASRARIEALEASAAENEVGKIVALEQRIDSIATALQASKTQNDELLTLTLQMAQGLAPIKSAIETIKGELARTIAAVVGGGPQAEAAPFDPAELVASMTRISARVTALEEQVKTAVATVDPTLAKTEAPTGADRDQLDTAKSSEPFDLVLDSTGNPAIRQADQLKSVRNELVNASNCKRVGAWLTPRTSDGDNAAFFVRDGLAIKICRRIGEGWFALKGEPDYPAFVVLQN